jgi:hypothetical protein
MNIYYIIYFFHSATKNENEKIESIKITLKKHDVLVNETTKAQHPNLMLVSTERDLLDVVKMVFGLFGKDDILVVCPRKVEDTDFYIHPKWLKGKLTIPQPFDRAKIPQQIEAILQSEPERSS